MDSKQAPPSYTEAVADTSNGIVNPGYVPPAGDQGSGAPVYPAQAGYPPEENQVRGGFGKELTVYSLPIRSYAAPTAAGRYPSQGQTGGYGFQPQTVVVTQPARGGAATADSIPDHMGLAVFSTLCCCLILGLVAIFKAQETQQAKARGDLRAAATNSVEARRISMVAIAVGCFSIVSFVIILIIAYQ